MYGIIFDVDGVIVDVRDSYHSAIAETFRYFSSEDISKDYIRRFKYEKHINNDWDATYELLKERGISVDYNELVSIFEDIYKNLRDREKLLLDDEFFKELKRLNVPLGIVTGRPREDLEYALNRFNLKEFFDVIVDEDDVNDAFLRKPNPFPLHMAVEILGVDSFIYIGDTPADGEMIYFYRKIYGKPCKLIHYREVQNSTDIGADLSANNRDELLRLILSEVSPHLEGG